LGIASAAGVLLALTSAGAAGTLAAATPYTVIAGQYFHATNLGPNQDTSCDILYDLYVPAGASAANPVPSILTTNGFGGSKDSQIKQAQIFAQHGYEVLSYSGLGFGGSSCLVYADAWQWDGRAASELVSLLGARPEVIKDAPGDPRVGHGAAPTGDSSSSRWPPPIRASTQ
jgi:ABC-2 type transport system ATP-binding protein